jgi:uncharacterized repeat protein (TIGR03803 family)
MKSHISNTLTILCRLLLITVVGLIESARGQKTLHNFYGTAGGNIPLMQGDDGNFYGTTFWGGIDNQGTMFQMTPDGIVTTLVSITGEYGTHPTAGLVQGFDGNFYGTTYWWGDTHAATNYNLGTVFQMAPDGTLTTLLSFNGTNGGNPNALVQGYDGNFYGTTHSGGSANLGTVFQMTADGTLTTLVSFNATNGGLPVAGLVQGNDGNFYGTTYFGGNLALNGGSGLGTVFKMTAEGLLTTLVSFNATNGGHPAAGLTQGSDGNFYGTTQWGGNLSLNNSNGFGTVFKMTPAGTLTTLVSFNATNGGVPVAGLVQGNDGNFYGTTQWGGNLRSTAAVALAPCSK